jgi:hypothetical protein
MGSIGPEPRRNLLVHQMALQILLLRFRAFQIRYQQTEFINQVLWLLPPLEEK